MEQVLFSKYSNERNRDLSIRTDIIRDNGVKFVRKEAAFPEAKTHIDKLIDYERLLDDKYSATCVKMNHGELDPAGHGIRFEFVKGETLESKLDALYLAGDYSGLLDLFREYVDIILRANGNKKFTVTESFETVFGTSYIGNEWIASDINNIDMVVGNVLIDQDTWHIIDYEWTFEFPIPVKFIIFRTIFYYVYASAKRDGLKDIGFYRLFDISEKEQQVFLEWEQHFQRYIISETTPIRDMYQDISKGNVSLENILEMKEIVSANNCAKAIQVYFDKGNGTVESDSIRVYPTKECDEVLHYEINVGDEVKGIRLDPADEDSIVSIKKLVARIDKPYELTFLTNGIEFGDSTYLFSGNDPWILINNYKAGTRSIAFEMTRTMVGSDVAEKVAVEFDKIQERINSYEEAARSHEEFVNRHNDALVENARLAMQVGDLNHRLYLAEASFHELQGSFCWKITKPIRILMSLLKGLFKDCFGFKMFLKGIFRLVTKGPKKKREIDRLEREQKRSFHIYDEISVACDMDELEKQRNSSKEQNVKFSVVVPLYNTPEIYLRKMIESVLYQTYTNLELVLVDGSDKKHKDVKRICKEYIYFDKRIVYKKLKKNLGIADNTNAALELASGDYITLFDHDDFMHPAALYKVADEIANGADFIYTDENTFHETIDDAFNPHFKPDYAPDYLRCINYICHLTTFSRDLYQQVGGFRKEFDGSQDYDMILRLTEKASKITHIPEVLYYWRAHQASVAMDISAKEYCLDSAKKALREHLKRVGLKGEVMDADFKSSYRIKYELNSKPLVSILIPNKDHIVDLKRCLDSIFEKSTYANYEIVIIENNSTETETFDYYEELKANRKIKVVTWEREFNYSAINNFGATFASGEYLLLLNNDVEVISPDWLQEMLMFVQRDDVAAAGAKLYYPNDTIQHAGVILGIGGVGGHSHKYLPRDDYGYFARLVTVQDLSAVTAACLMVKKSVFDEISGLDEDYQVAFNDVDFCMRIREKGYLIVYTPYAELYHYESISRGAEDTPEKVARFNGEVSRFMKRWDKELKAGDPYYNPNLSLVFEDFRLKDN